MTPQQILQRRYEQARPRTAISLRPADFDKFAGYYLVPGMDQVLHVCRQGDDYLMRGNLSVAPVQISFNPAGGQVTGAVVHQGGLLQTLDRISAQKAQEACQKSARIVNSDPVSDTAAAGN